MEDGAQAIMRDAHANYLLGNEAMTTATSGEGGDAATAPMVMTVLAQRGFWQWSDVATTAGDDQ